MLNYPPDGLIIFNKLECPHIRDLSNSSVSLTLHRKVCSADKGELLRCAGKPRDDERLCETCSRKPHGAL